MKTKQDTKANLLRQYINFFNRYRNAGIEAIGNPDDHIKAVVVRYRDREVELPPVLGWVDLFDKLTELHPRPVPRHSDPPAQERRVTRHSKRQHEAS